MKNKTFKILLTLIGFISTITPLYSKGDLQTHKIKFAAIFSSITIPSIWQLENSCSNGVEFVHTENQHVSFGIAAGKPLKKQGSLDELQSEFKKFINKESKTIPLLEKSFGWLADKKEAEEMRKALYPNFKRVKFGNIEWLKIVCAVEIEIDTLTEGYSESIQITTQNIVYATFINNRLHLAECCAPEDYYEDYSDLFNTTMQQISSET